MSGRFFDPNQWQTLEEGLTPMPGIGEPCPECGKPVHIYEANISVMKDGRIRCGNCTRAAEKRLGKDPRRFFRNFFWRLGHDPNDDEATEDSNVVYMNLEHHEGGLINQRDELLNKGGPETPFPCEKCGMKLRAVASKTVMEILAPTGYKPTAGTAPPKERVVALVCPNDRDSDRHPFMQIRESFLRDTMARQPR